MGHSDSRKREITRDPSQADIRNVHGSAVLEVRRRPASRVGTGAAVGRDRDEGKVADHGADLDRDWHIAALDARGDGELNLVDAGAAVGATLGSDIRLDGAHIQLDGRVQADPQTRPPDDKRVAGRGGHKGIPSKSRVGEQRANETLSHRRVDPEVGAGENARPRARMIEGKDSEGARHDRDRTRGAGLAIQCNRDRAVAGGRRRRHNSSQLVNRGVDQGNVDLGASHRDLHGGQSRWQGGIRDSDGGHAGSQTLAVQYKHTSLGNAVVRQSRRDATGGVDDAAGRDDGRLGLSV